MPAPLVQEVYTPVPQRTQGQATFDNNSDNFLASLPGVATSMNTLATYLDSLSDSVIALESDITSIESQVNAKFNSIVTLSQDSLSNKISAEQSAITSEQFANLARVSVSSGAKPYRTFANALSDLNNISLNQVVEVVSDETKSNQRSLYVNTSGALVFLRPVEQYISPFSYIKSDSSQNMITKLLVLTKQIPEVQNRISSDFINQSYSLG